MTSLLKAMLVVAMASLLSAPGSHAQVSRLSGEFVLLTPGADVINRAIEQGIASMNFITRPIARGRLRKTNEPYRTLIIDHTPSEVRVVVDGKTPVVTPANGEVIKWTREDGEVFDVSTRWRGGALEQTFIAPDGRRVNLYTLNADGTLDMQVTVTSPRLPRPIVYRLAYRRAP